MVRAENYDNFKNRKANPPLVSAGLAFAFWVCGLRFTVFGLPFWAKNG
jgi:hypothetical protein